eukprot:TRINITY_DN5658_c0_g1_i1.p1 TRINITY_DN5658_c0_g1~~TRINITY_DN5658_c0_g1_i1.p1  ORF type:complete len:377 (-),score=138.95 TRINITY_DN5658_c0_g1_i1:62-1192(-)
MPGRVIAKGLKVRYAVVAGGWISQGAFIPGIPQTTNSEFTALISGDPVKNQKLGEKYNLKHTYSYEEFPKALEEGGFDALYIATPNWMHRQFAVPALEAGYHVLLEKPMEVSEDDCIAINEAAKKGGAKLMIAYRLHCEPATVEIINKVRSGEIGDPRIFNSLFGQNLKESNHRAKNGYDAGPIPDIGTYPFNAVRTIFGMEPIEVTARACKTPGREFNFDDIVSVTLKFPGERIANMTLSYTGSSVGYYTVIGTKGQIHADPCFAFAPGASIDYVQTNEKGEKKTHKGPVTDQFAGETDYFSQCIIDGVDPEPDGEEGLRDVRVIVAVKKALETGQTQKLEPLPSRRHATNDQARKFSYGKQPKEEEFINCETPA